MKFLIYLIIILLLGFTLILLGGSGPRNGLNATLNTGLLGLSIMIGSALIALSIIVSKRDY